ncbi:MAG: cytochrome c [Azonexus sp.]|jgi:cytochrome c553|nr:cytochrome c [Azonexus sp.]
MRRQRFFDKPFARAGFLPFFCALAFAAPAMPAAAAEDSDAALASKLGPCVACHGADGIGKAPQYPNLQGQKAGYLEKQLRAFRSGERKDPNMSIMAAKLSDQDISDLAAYFAQVK